MLQTSVEMVKPGGTGRPARHISASPAPLPPRMSFIFPSPSAPKAPNEYTYFFILSLPMNWLRFLKNPRSWKTPSELRAAAPADSAARLDPGHSPGSFQKINLLSAAARRSFRAPADNPGFRLPAAHGRSRRRDRSPAQA